MESENEKQRRFCAFISYRHLDNAQEGRRWAEWLHHALENYRVPDSLRKKLNRSGKPILKSFYPVFRDEEEMTTAKGLGELVEDGLQRSEWLIVLCSPRSAESPWVNAEVNRFRELEKGDRILVVIIEGEPNAIIQAAANGDVDPRLECLPKALRLNATNDAGQVADKTALDHLLKFDQKLAADFRPENTFEQGYTSSAAYRDALENKNQKLPESVRLHRQRLRTLEERYGERLKLMRLKIFAGILDLDLGELTQRDAETRARRARRVAALSGAVTVILIFLLVWAVLNRNRAVTARDESRRQGNISLARALAAEAPRLQGQEKLDEVAALMARQAFLLNQRNGGEALAQVDAALRAVMGASSFSILQTKIGGAYNSVAWSTSGWSIVNGSPSRTASWWNWNRATAPKPVLLSHPDSREAFVSVAVADDGQNALFATGNGDILLARKGTSSVEFEQLQLGSVFARSLAINSKEGMIAIGGQDGTLRLIDFCHKPNVTVNLTGDSPISCVRISGAAHCVVWGTTDGVVRVADYRTAITNSAQARILRSFGENIFISSLALNSNHLVAISGWTKPSAPLANPHGTHDDSPILPKQQHPFVVVDLSSGEIRNDIGQLDSWAESLAFDPSGRYLAAGMVSSQVRIWDLASHPPAETFIKGHKGSVNGVAWDEQGNWIASLDIYGNLRASLFSRASESPTVKLGAAIMALAVNPNNQSVTIVEGGGRVHEWNPKTGLFITAGNSQWDTKAAAISQDGHLLALASGHGNPGQGLQVRSRNGRDTQAVSIPESPAWVESVAFSRSGLLVCGGEGEIRYWLPGLSETRRIQNLGGWIRCLTISESGKYMVSSGDDGSNRVWRIESQDIILDHVLPSVGSRVRSLAINDADDVAIGTDDGRVFLFTLDGIEKRVLADHRGSVTAIAFLSNDTMFATGGEDGTVRMYRLDRKHAPIVLRAEDGSVNAMAWRPESRELVTGYSSGRVTAWLTDTAEIADSVCRVVGRDMTKSEWDRYVGKDVPYEPTCSSAILAPQTPMKR